MPKPSVAAGALNELVHEDPSEVRALVQSGKRLRQAQEAAVSGKKGADLNEAIKEHRVALDRVQRDLRRRKLSAATIDKATQTLRVASLDPELWPLLERGLLHEDLTSSGFGIDPGLVPATPKKRAAPKDSESRRWTSRQRSADAGRERKLDEAEKALAEAQRGAERALKDVERATADVESARSRARRARRLARGVLRIEPTQRLDQDRRDGVVPHPVAVAGDHVPGRVLGRGLGQSLLVRRPVLVQARAVSSSSVELPALRRIATLREPLLLLLGARRGGST